MSKIKPKTIRLERAEGLIAECNKPVTVSSWAHANAVLFNWSRTAPKTGGYDKCDFKVVFEDGTEYEGRYDLVHYTCEHPNLARHVRSFVRYLAGEYPLWCTSEEDKARVRKHQKSLGSDTQEEAKKWLETYETM